VAALRAQVNALAAALAVLQKSGAAGTPGPVGPAGPPGVIDVTALKAALAGTGITCDIVDSTGAVSQSQFVQLGGTLKLQLSPVKGPGK
jgi:hypothetical protein